MVVSSQKKGMSPEIFVYLGELCCKLYPRKPGKGHSLVRFAFSVSERPTVLSGAAVAACVTVVALLLGILVFIISTVQHAQESENNR